jgi:hypothetical protein
MYVGEIKRGGLEGDSWKRKMGQGLKRRGTEVEKDRKAKGLRRRGME